MSRPVLRPTLIIVAPLIIGATVRTLVAARPSEARKPLVEPPPRLRQQLQHRALELDDLLVAAADGQPCGAGARAVGSMRMEDRR